MVKRKSAKKQTTTYKQTYI